MPCRPIQGRLPDRSVPLPALEAHVRRSGRDASRWTSPRTAASARATSSSSIRTTSASTSSLHDAVQRIRFEHPEVRSVDGHERAGSHLLLGRQHLHAGPVDARLEGQLLQVHQRDAQRARGCEPPLRAQVPRRGQRRRAPAAATSWRSPATRSGSSTTARRRFRCPRSRSSASCPAPAASRASPTSATCATISPTSSAR